MLVDPNRTGVHLLGKRIGALRVRGPNRTAQAPSGAIGPRHCFAFVSEAHYRKYWAELLLVYQTGPFFNISDDGGTNKVTGLVRKFAACNYIAVVLSLFDEFLHLVVLHFIVQWTELCALLKAVTNNGVISDAGKFVADFVINVFMHVQALHGDANLTTVLKRAIEQFRRSLFRIYVVQYDSCVIAAKLQRNTLEQPSSASHYLCASFRRTGE